MSAWFRGKRGGLAAFAAIAALVIGGLAWVTHAALGLEEQQREARLQAYHSALQAYRSGLKAEENAVKAQQSAHRADGLSRQRLNLAYQLEREQRDSQRQNELNAKLRLALWRLDSRVFPVISRESSRPYAHYNVMFTPPLALVKQGGAWGPAPVLEPSPLLSEEIPDWIMLHFQTDGQSYWESPQVLTKAEMQCLNNDKTRTPTDNVTHERRELLADLRTQQVAKALFEGVRQQERNWEANSAFYHNLRNNSVDYAVGVFNRVVGVEQPSQQSQQPGQPGQSGPGGQGQFGGGFGQNPFAWQQALYDREYTSRAMQRYELEQQGLGRGGQKDEGFGKVLRNEPVLVRISPMTPLWVLTGDNKESLVLTRRVEAGKKQFVQGLVIDWVKLQTVLADDVRDLFPEATVEPVIEDVPAHPERTMTALPLQLNPNLPPVQNPQLAAQPEQPDPALAEPQQAASPPTAPLPPPTFTGVTPLRLGLVLAWVAALVALAAVGLGGWSLIDLSERRIHFVSAVTHELRTPLTTLRLYLDMLTSGMVKDEATKEEYLHTLNAETDRLNRLVNNVLDFSRLENHTPRLERTDTPVEGLLSDVSASWQCRCKEAEKELVVENRLGEQAHIVTDVKLVQQIVGNLIDNACKYSKGASDPHIWVRVRSDRPGRVTFEIEDRGPGVPANERSAIFRPFRRGREAHATTGGVGLGLALARRWAQLLGGDLSVQPGTGGAGARFRLELPIT